VLLDARGPKVTRWFRGVPADPHDDPNAMLRVSRYVEEFDIETPEGSVRIPSRHVRFSIWAGDRVQAVVSIPDDEASELAGFLVEPTEHADTDPERAVPDQAGPLGDRSLPAKE
jgi:hypothetical protein